MYEKAMAVIAIALFTALLVTLWLRDRLRRAVCRAADPHMRNSTQEREWLVTYEKFLYSSAQTQRISVLKRNLPQLPAEVQERFKRFQVAQIALTVTVIALLVFFVVGLAVQWARGLPIT